MTTSFRQGHSTLLQKTANLVDDGSPTGHPTFTDAVYSLQVQLLLSLDWNETHGRSLHGFGDRLGIDVIALVGFDVRLYVLRRHQSDVVALSSQRPTQKMRSATCFHSNPMNAHVGCKR